MSEVFTFVDATHDKDAKFGAKSKDKIWFTHELFYFFKEWVANAALIVDISNIQVLICNQAWSIKLLLLQLISLIPKDLNMLHQIRERFMQIKAITIRMPELPLKTKNLHLAAVKKNNMKNKNRDLDSYYTKLRAPFENVFSKQNKRVRYQGIAKNQFTAFMQAITFKTSKDCWFWPHQPLRQSPRNKG